jgi:hypothetical protein
MIAGVSAAMAEIPAPSLMGVQRVVVECQFDSSLSVNERRTICEQLVRKAQRVTSLPVTVASKDDLISPDLARLSEQLLLQVKVSATAVDTGRKTLSMTVTPVRLARPQGKMDQLTSSASLVKVQDDWVVQGPIDSFQKLLGSTGPHRLHKPITADNK